MHSPKKTEAERLLAEADTAVSRALLRHSQAESELRELREQIASLQHVIEQRTYAASAGEDSASSYDPAEDRATLASLNQQAADLDIRVRALADRAQSAKAARGELIAEEFLTLSTVLARQVEEYARDRAAFEGKWEAEAEKYKGRQLQLRAKWRHLLDPLPQPLRTQVSVTSDLRLDPPADQWADPGLARYVPDESWPDWARAILAESRRLRDALQRELDRDRDSDGHLTRRKHDQRHPADAREH